MRTARLFPVLGLLSFIASANSGPSTTQWVEDARAFSCNTHLVEHQRFIRLKKRPLMGRELGVETPSKEFFFLVLTDDPPNATLGLDSERFAQGAIFDINASTLVARPEGNDSSTKVFSTPGSYTFYMSDNLESEDGGYVCRVAFVKSSLTR